MDALSRGCLRAIIDGDDPVKPVVQVLGVKMIDKRADQTDRYRLLLSDGEYQHSSCMLGTQMNNLVVGNELVPLCIAQMDKYICNCVDKQTNKYVIIILDISVLVKDCPKLGDPRPVINPVGGVENAESSRDSEMPYNNFDAPASVKRSAPVGDNPDRNAPAHKVTRPVTNVLATIVTVIYGSE
ncbi:hypothetical protein ACOME3_009264 [Neoechinorhynchus agilis]